LAGLKPCPAKARIEGIEEGEVLDTLRGEKLRKGLRQAN
jgi:hypothetical protein